MTDEDASLYNVSEKVYGDIAHWTVIRDANPGVDSTTVRPGTELTIPPISEGDGRIRLPRGCDRRGVY